MREVKAAKAMWIVEPKNDRQGEYRERERGKRKIANEMIRVRKRNGTSNEKWL